MLSSLVKFSPIGSVDALAICTVSASLLIVARLSCLHILKLLPAVI